MGMGGTMETPSRRPGSVAKALLEAERSVALQPANPTSVLAAAPIETPADQPTSAPSNPLQASLCAAGMPAERAARIAARMAFVDMKRSFMDAADRIEGLHAERVRLKVRQAHDPIELLHLREVVSALLPEHEHAMRERLRAKLLTVFSDTTTGAPREF